MQVQTEEVVTEEQSKLDKLEVKFDLLPSLIEKGKSPEFSSSDDHLAGTTISLNAYVV